MAQDFEITVGSDEDYEDLIADIYYQKEFVCLLSQENGYTSLDMDIHPRPNGQSWKFKLSEFEGAIAQAKKRLWELRKVR